MHFATRIRRALGSGTTIVRLVPAGRCTSEPSWKHTVESGVTRREAVALALVMHSAANTILLLAMLANTTEPGFGHKL